MRLPLPKLLLIIAALAGFVPPARSQTVYGLVGPDDVLSFSLISFDATAPGAIALRGRVTGLVSGEFLVGIERRPATGQLLALGYRNSTAGQQLRLYELSMTTAAATAIGPAIALNLGNLSSRIGFSIDPTTDQLRVVTAGGNSYRLSSTTGALLATDSNLTYAATDPNAGQTPNVQAIGFTNNYSGSAATQLFGIDRTGNRLIQQAPGTNGTLATVGPLGLSLDAFDFGIAANAQTQTNSLYLMTSTATGQFSFTTNWYRVSAATGAATLVGTVGTPNWFYNIIDIAVPNSLITATRNQAEVAAEVSVSPNPTQGEASLSFRLHRASTVELRVTDALGRRVAAPPATTLAAGPQTLRWSPQCLAPGLYFLRLMVDGTPAATARLLVQ
ncbi:DUF4394 domain-containing protein [Hymenobacter sp. 5317J-9]|uniref:DUF4394 domain-containing protein n=1 Tax=Hymenobacter sp. 5317J-9 TaxID=2932250 RepID=UPI001FD6D373|nr:DUF4394 domain-containing protein [Hymenobacter sp. 5317J-9]UOQ99289.1 DUF4394 domain-containing protein [Hymenobacter sp. 5317J-9]